MEILSPGFDPSRAFVPAGDGARNFYRIMGGPDVTAEVRVRRDGLISSARDEVEMYTEPRQHLWLRRPQPWHEVLVKVSGSEIHGDHMTEGLRRAAEGYPSTVVNLAPAVRLDAPRLAAAAKGFLRFVHEAYGFLGYSGPVQIEARISGGHSYLALSVPPEGAEPRFYRVSEQTELRASVEAEQADLASREIYLVEDLLNRLAWHFGLEGF